jgi:hypothetical protein
MRAVSQSYRREDRQAEPQKMSDMLGELAASSAALIRDEIDLARQELKESARQMRPGMVAATAGLGIAAIAVLVLVAAAVIGLGNVIGYGLSALLIGAVMGAIGGSTLLLVIRRIRQTSLKPEQTMKTLEEDKAWLKQLR